MNVIKGVLEEELQNSLQMKKKYEKALKALPKGSLVEKEIKGHKYFYIAKRAGVKVRFEYKGKISEKEKKQYLEVKELRAKYRKNLTLLKKQISFLERTLNDKDIQSMY